MRKTGVLLGTLLLAALFICGASVLPASALTLEECQEAATMPEGSTSTEYTSGKCEATGAGHWWRVPVTGKVVFASQGPTSVAATIGGVEMEVQCASLSGVGSPKNLEVGGARVIEDSAITISYELCTVTKPTGGICTVPAALTTNLLKSATVPGTMTQKYEVEAGTTLATLTFSGALCPTILTISPKKLTGSLTAEVNEASGGVEEFTTTSGSALKVAGQTATFVSKNRFATENEARVTARTP